MSRKYKFTQEEFLRDVSRHVMTVVRDDGVNRHLHFQRPGDSCYWFDIITWGGRLYIGGDCGTWVFNRLHDMFEFFRSGNGRINPSYWAEKLESTPRKGAEEFSEDRFKEVVNGYRVRWVRDAARENILSKEQRRELWEAVESEVMQALGAYGEHGAMLAAHDFEWRSLQVRRPWWFEDFGDHRFTEHTHQYLWNCYAIVWAIQRYDESKVVASSETAA